MFLLFKYNSYYLTICWLWWIFAYMIIILETMLEGRLTFPSTPLPLEEHISTLNGVLSESIGSYS